MSLIETSPIELIAFALWLTVICPALFPTEKKRKRYKCGKS